MIQNSGEESIFRIMENPIIAYTPIFYEVDKIISKGTQVFFVYGDRDWIDTDMSGIHISSKLKEAGYKVYMLDDWDHHLYLDNPEGLLQTLDECMAN